MDQKNQIEKIGVITNARAGSTRNKGKDIIRLGRLNLPGVEIIIRLTTRPDQVRDALKELLDKKIDILIIDGGDGTIEKVITTYLYFYTDPLPPVLLTQGGSMNIIAKHYNPCGNILELVFCLLNYGYTLEQHQLLVVQSNDKWNPPLPAYGSIFCLGGPTEVLKWYSDGSPGVRRALHAIAYGLTMSLNWMEPIIDIKQREMKIIVDEQELRLKEKQALACVVSTVSKLFFKLSPFPFPPSLGHPAWLAYSISARELAISIPLLGFGMIPPDNPRYQCGVFRKELIVKAKGDFTIDGEIFTSLNTWPATIRLGLGPIISIVKVNQKRPA